jgi:hypothetical protein
MISPRELRAVERAAEVGAGFDGAAEGLEYVEPPVVDEQPASATIANAVPATDIARLDRVFMVGILSLREGDQTSLFVLPLSADVTTG